MTELDLPRSTSRAHQGDPVHAGTGLLAAGPGPESDDVGLVRSTHRGAEPDDVVAFGSGPTVRIERRTHRGQR